MGDEDAADDVVGPRLYAAGVDFAYVEEVVHPQDALLNVATDADEFERLLRSGPFDVVAFEALLDNLPSLRHPNDAQELRGALHPLKAVLRRTGVTGLGTLHTIKAQASDFRSKMAGSHQFNAVAAPACSCAAPERSAAASNSAASPTTAPGRSRLVRQSGDTCSS